MRANGFYWVSANYMPNIDDDSWESAEVARWSTEEDQWFVTGSEIGLYESQVRVVCGPIEVQRETA